MEKETKKIAFVYFTYGKDFNELMLSIRSVIATVPKGITYEIHVFDDGDNACTDEQIAQIKTSYNYRQTFWNRLGNLHGQEQLLNEVEIYESLSRDGAVVVKIDSDVVMINQDWLDIFSSDESKLLSGAFFRGQPMYLWGGAYAIKKDILPSLILDIKTYIAHAFSYENYEVGMRAQRLFGYSIIDRYQVMRDGFFQGEILEQTVTDVDKFMNLRVATLGFAKSDANYPYRMDLMTQLVEKLEAKQKDV